MNPARSTFGGAPPAKSFTVRIEDASQRRGVHAGQNRRDGRTTTSSTILYFDGKPRDFQDLGCSGAQSSRRVDSQTVEILRKCASGEWTRFVRRLAEPKELVLEITEQLADGRRFERRVVLERQSGGL